ncbi:hypothetical protein QTG56_25955 (plasmid) [Rossellomorea sp. AcN35-11]|nr:hypothetical protein [Rossellomorea aquimaris]WJV32062.1 hypothetical protein QTG56_25955 [Rossellomorea sp. AcN35-11]
MKSEELCKIVKSGKKPIIRFTELIYEYGIDESVDPGMIGKVIGVTQEYDDSFRFLVDLNDFVEQNKSVASTNWYDSNGDPRLTWFDTDRYPKDGIEAVYFPVEREVPVEFIEDTSLMNEYLATDQRCGYINWLEKEVIKLRGSK